MKRLILLIFVALMASSSIVSAAFSLSPGSSGIDVCKGSTAVLMTYVSGSGSFSVSSSGNAKLFTTTVPQVFSLTEGKQTVYSYVNPPSITSPGKYNFAVEVSDGSEKRTESYEVNVKDCRGSSLKIEPEKRLLCPGDKTSYTLTIENIGEYDETFDLGVEGTGKEWVNLSVGQVFLMKGEKKTFEAKVDLPSTVYGLYEPTVNARSKNKLSSATAKVTLEIKPCYEYSLSLSEPSFDVCEGKETELKLKLKNEGSVKNSFGINIEGASWAASSLSVEVDSGEEKEIPIKLNPPAGLKENQRTVNIAANSLSDLGKVRKKTNAKVNVDKCHAIDIQLTGNQNICNVKKDYSYPITLKNLGKEEDKLKLKVEGPEWVSLKKDSFELGKGKEAETSLEVNLPEKIPYGDYNIRVLGVLENGFETSQSMNLKIVEEEECYASSIDSEKSDFLFGIEKGKTLTIVLKNNGLEEAEYIISLGGNASEFSLVNPERVKLSPGGEEELYLYVSPTIITSPGEYILSVNAAVRESALKFSQEFKIQVVESLGENGKYPPSQIFSDFLNKIKGLFGSSSDEGLKIGSETISGQAVKSGEDEINPGVFDNIMIGNITFSKINIGSINSGEENEGQKIDLSKYKNYIFSALFIIAVVILFASGLGKKIIDFFDEE